MECEFCSKILKNEITLQNHQKTAKYCLRIQDENIVKNKNFICKYCYKKLSENRQLQKHELKCPQNEQNKIIEELKLELENGRKYKNKIIEELENEQKYKNKIIEELENELKDRDKIIEELKFELENERKDKVDRLERLASIKSNNYNIKTLNKNNILNSLKILDLQHLTEHAKKLTIEHIKKGREGIIDHAKEVFKDRACRTDISRKNLKLKNKDVNDVNDVNGISTMKKYGSSILNPVKDFIGEIFENIPIENIDVCDAISSAIQMKFCNQLGMEIKELTNGQENDLSKDLINNAIQVIN